MKISTQSIVTRKSQPLFSRLDDDLLALDSQAGVCYSLNSSATRVWELIERPTSVRAICDQLTREFEVDEATCTEEVVALVGRLHSRGLVQVG